MKKFTIIIALIAISIMSQSCNESKGATTNSDTTTAILDEEPVVIRNSVIFDQVNSTSTKVRVSINGQGLTEFDSSVYNVYSDKSTKLTYHVHETK